MRRTSTSLRRLTEPKGAIREFTFKLHWNGEEAEIELSTDYGLSVSNIEILSATNKAFFTELQNRAARIKGESPAQRQAFIDQLTHSVESKRHAQSATPPDKLPVLKPTGEDPFDCYFVHWNVQLPKVVADIVPSMNIFMLFLAALLLIPNVSDTKEGVSAAVALSALVMSTQYFSSFLAKKLGAALLV